MSGLGAVLRVFFGVVAIGCGFAMAGESYNNFSGDAYNENDSRKITNRALKYGVNGNLQKRTKLLELAIKKTPEYAPAHWALGHILQAGEWMSLASIQEQAASDKRLVDYEQVKQRFLEDGSQNHEAVAKWCKRNDLEDEAFAHWTAVLRDDPGNRTALANLDSGRHQGALVDENILQTQTSEDRTVLHAQKMWAKKVARWSRSRTPRDKKNDPILREVRSINDKEAIPAFEQLATTLGENAVRQERTHDLCDAFIDALTEMRGSSAIESLVRFSVFTEDESLRKKAADQLKDKPKEISVPYLLSGLQPITESKFSIAADREGTVRYEHNFLSKGKELNRELERTKVSRAEVIQVVDPTLQALNRRDRSNMQGLQEFQRMSDAWIETQLEMMIFQKEAQQAEEELAKSQSRAKSINERVATSLRVATNQNFGNDPQKWWDYWSEYRGYEVSRGSSKEYEYNERAKRSYQAVPPTRCECFVAGTIVYTKKGNVAIETIQPGDFVLSCEPETGELNFRMVRDVTRRAPSPMVKIYAEEEIITATVGHPFWVESQGWRMAKQLKAGDYLMAMVSRLLLQK